MPPRTAEHRVASTDQVKVAADRSTKHIAAHIGVEGVVGSEHVECHRCGEQLDVAGGAERDVRMHCDDRGAIDGDRDTFSIGQR